MSTRLSLKIDDPPDQADAHEELALLFNYLAAHEIEETLSETGLDKATVTSVHDSLVFDLAMLSDQGQIAINDKVYFPRVAFVDEDGELLPGAADFDFLHEYAIIDDEDLNTLSFTSAVDAG